MRDEKQDGRDERERGRERERQPLIGAVVARQLLCRALGVIARERSWRKACN
jgi:hypothetical protein